MSINPANIQAILTTAMTDADRIKALRDSGIPEDKISVFMQDGKLEDNEIKQILDLHNTQGTAQNPPKAVTTFTVGNGDGNLPQALADQLVTAEYGQVLVKQSDGTYRLADGKKISDVQTAINKYNQAQPQTFNLPKALLDKLPDNIKAKLTQVEGQADHYTVQANDAQSVHDALTKIQGCTADEPQVDTEAQTPTIKCQDITPAWEQEVEVQKAYLKPEDIQKADLQTKKGRKEFAQVVAGDAETGTGLQGWMKDNQIAADYTAARMQHAKKIDRWTENMVKDYQKAHPNDEDSQMLAAMNDYIKLLPDNDLRKGFLQALGDNFDAQRVKDVCQANGIKDLKELCSMAATQKYLNSRSDRQLNNLRNDFVDDMAESEANEYRYAQEYEKTVPCFNSDAAETGKNSNDGKIYNDIGDHGRNLVMKVPAVFCDEVQTGGDFTADGKSYKFNPEKYKEFFHALAYDESSDGAFMDNYLRDHNITLQEADRAIIDKEIFDDDMTLEDIIHTGKRANGKVNYRERRRLKHMSEAAGIHFEKDFTPRKRILTVLGTTTAGALAGGAIGSAIRHTGASQTVQDGIQRVVEHVNGPAGGYDNVSYKPLMKTIAGDVTNFLPQGAGIGALVGLGTGIAIARKQTATGTRFEHIVNLEGRNTSVHHDAQRGEEQTLTIDPPKVQTYTFQEEVQQQIETKKLVNYRGLEAYNVLYPNVNNKNEFINAYIDAFNKQFGTNLKRGQMPDKFYAIPITINGRTINPAENWQEIYSTIAVGRPGGNNAMVRGKATRTVQQQAQATRRGYM